MEEKELYVLYVYSVPGSGLLTLNRGSRKGNVFLFLLRLSRVKDPLLIKGRTKNTYDS